MASKAASTLLLRSLRITARRPATFAALQLAKNTSSKISFSTLGQSLADLAVEYPNKDAVRYEHKNVKWSFKHIEYFAEALAIGLLENELRPGDAMLSWLPLHYSEQHILQFACSKAGFVLYHLDPSLAQKNQETFQRTIKSALDTTEAVALFSPTAHYDVDYISILKKVIPELRFFDTREGMPFFSPHVPHLRFAIHPGFDIPAGGRGMIPLKHMLVPVTGELDTFLNAKLDGKTPLLGELKVNEDGTVTKGKVLTNDEVWKGKVWPEISSILSKEYIEVEGVGVVF